MSVLVECSMGELNGDRKPLFPLFQKGPKPQSIPSEILDESSSEKPQDKPPQSDVLGKHSVQGCKRSKKAREAENTSSNESNEPQAQANSLDVDPNESRKKRRKTSSIDGKDDPDNTRKALVDGREGTSQQGVVNLSGATSLPPRSALEALSDKSLRKKQKKNVIQQVNPVHQDPGTRKPIGREEDISQTRINQQTGTLPTERPSSNSVSSKHNSLDGELSRSNTVTNLNPSSTSIVTPELKPTKLLKFNPKTGTIGSPPKAKQPQDTSNSNSGVEIVAEVLRSSGSKKKSKRSIQPNSETGTLTPPSPAGTTLGLSPSSIDSGSSLRGLTNSRVSVSSSTVIAATSENLETNPGTVLAFHPQVEKTDSSKVLAQDAPSSGIHANKFPETTAVSATISPENPQTKPKKVLYFNTTTGTFGSPPTKQTNTMTGTTTKRVKRGKQPKSLPVAIRYCQNNLIPLQKEINSTQSETVHLEHGSKGDVVSSTTTLDARSNLAQNETIISDHPLKSDVVFSKTTAFGSQSDPILIKNENPLSDERTTSPSTDLSLGQRISRILNGEERFELPKGSRAATPRLVKSTRRPLLSSNTSSHSTRNSSEAITDIIDLVESGFKARALPRQPRAGPPKDYPTNSLSTRFEPQSPIRRKQFESLGESAKVLKFPGAMEPCWPCEGMIHVNPDLTAFQYPNFNHIQPPDIKSMNGKWKTHAVAIGSEEDIMQFIARRLNIREVAKNVREINLDKFPPIPSCLRLPEKLHETGPGIQSLVRVELRTPVPSTNQEAFDTEDEFSTTDEHALGQVHPGLAKTYASIPNNPSAFDRGQCETQTWAQKHAPEKADQVLQPGSEALDLREWLISQTVNSVESTGSSTKPTAPKKRKRKPTKQEDSFIVYSDEEDGEEIRNKNTILISGPHGCGKTAAVYAVAKELGFEIFEINSGSRRSGRDILAKVGDMIGNHLVQGVKELPQLDCIAEERRAEFENDLKTGRQGTLNTFFTAKPSKPKFDEQKPAQTTAEAPATTTQTLPIVQKKQATLGSTANNKAPPKEQKQSLILIEEADMIYKQDSQFWSTIEKLQDISRRPIILTCSDENAIPLSRDTLHTILRFESPPIDLAVDHMLLIAASEGHLIPRQAVKTLYEGRGLDLRASLTELNFWCQFAVGDVSRGLGWYYPRTCGREDVDENGHAIRVVSEGTYKPGMGWLSQDILKSRAQYLDVEDETLHEACESLGLDLGDWEKTIKINSWADKIQEMCNTNSGRLPALNLFSQFTDNMSDADILSGGLFGLPDQTSLDATQPGMWESECEEYPILYHVTNAPETHMLHAPEAVEYSPTTKDIGLFIRSRGRSLLEMNPPQLQLKFRQDLDSVTESHILQLACNQATNPSPWLSQDDLTTAFKPFRSPDTTNQKTDTLQFKRTQQILTEDLAPYVRGIMAYDARLQKERERISNLLSEGGRPGKRQRTTRSAFSAMAGGQRDRTRKDRWFSEFPDLNSIHVLHTAGDGWTEAVMEIEMEQRKQLVGVLEEEMEIED